MGYSDGVSDERSVEPHHNPSMRAADLRVGPKVATQETRIDPKMQSEGSHMDVNDIFAYSVREVANAMDVNKETVLRRLRKGELTGVRQGKAWKIYPADLRKWIHDKLGMYRAQRTCSDVENDGTKMEYNSLQADDLSWYELMPGSDVELKSMRGSKRMLAPRDAAVKLMGKFRWQARRLVPKNLHLQDDLVQEMCLATLCCFGLNTVSFYCWRAESRAKNYLKYELRRGMQSIEELKREPARKIKELTEEQEARIKKMRLLFAMAELPMSLLADEFDIRLPMAG
jgi:excisionase family DNA binding protein